MIFKKGDIVQFTHGSSHRETARGIGVVVLCSEYWCDVMYEGINYTITANIIEFPYDSIKLLEEENE